MNDKFPINTIAQIEAMPRLNLICSRDETFLRQQMVFIKKLWREWAYDPQTPRPVWILTVLHNVGNGVHYTSLDDFWRQGGGFLKHSDDARMIVSTQHDEVINACHAVFGERMQYHRIDPRNGKHELVSYDNEALAASMEFNIEVR